MSIRLRKILFGSPLATSEHEHQRLGKFKALAVFSSDALSSVAYATEEILLVLMLAGPVAIHLANPIALTICTLIAIVTMSYYQTIHAYPEGGGSYRVAYENLGPVPGLVAASALLLDYVLTVAVSISAGVFAITSAVPELIPYRVGICLLAVAVITIGNLRGVRESATIFAVPTYCFLFAIMGLLVSGGYQVLSGTISPFPASDAGLGANPLTIYLILRAFSSGCTALTGIEAISNGVMAFRKPESRNATITLIWMSVLLTVMFLGITLLANYLHVLPVHEESVLSRLGRAVFGDGFLYFFLQGATFLVLILAANTAYADFPRLGSIMARDGYLPRQLANLGDRLVFSNGIILLAVIASLLIIHYQGNTNSLIPLYAVGVFASFTLSQIGMVRRWFRLRGRGWKFKAAMNGLGAVSTCCVTLIIIESKFIQGAWMIVLLIPVLVFAFMQIKSHYDAVARQISLERLSVSKWHRLQFHASPRAVIPVSRVNRGTLAAVKFAQKITPDVHAVTVNINPEATAALLKSWSEWVPELKLDVLDSPYRSMIEPFLEYLDNIDRVAKDKSLAIVVLPEIVPARWWQAILHNQSGLLLKTVLRFREAARGRIRVIVDVPYRLHR